MLRNFRISPSACITAAFLLLTLPLNWLLAAFTAAVFHELCHYAALRLCSIKPQKLRIGSNAAIMEADSLPCSQELFCTLAGPMGSLSLLLLFRWFPRIAICALFHGAYNLLPLYPLDGGRILQCTSRLLLPPCKSLRFIRIVETLCLSVILLVALYASFLRKLGLLPLFLTAILFLNQQNAKIPCKPRQLGVQ